MCAASDYYNWTRRDVVRVRTLSSPSISPTPSPYCHSRHFVLSLPLPPQHLSVNCVLGATVVFERRRADRCCLNGPGYIREINFTRCTCNQDDFEW